MEIVHVEEIHVKMDTIDQVMQLNNEMSHYNMIHNDDNVPTYPQRIYIHQKMYFEVQNEHLLLRLFLLYHPEEDKIRNRRLSDFQLTYSIDVIVVENWPLP
jgi:hypothetical protein